MSIKNSLVDHDIKSCETADANAHPPEYSRALHAHPVHYRLFGLAEFQVLCSVACLGFRVDTWCIVCTSDFEFLVQFRVSGCGFQAYGAVQGSITHRVSGYLADKKHPPP